MEIEIRKTPYAGWPNCYRVANGRIELIVTGDVGPRVIRFGFVGGVNEFAEFPEELGKIGGEEWRTYGGHRLWHSPEKLARTYFPDNGPVEVEILPDGLRITQPLETNCGIRKRLHLTMSQDRPEVAVEHFLTNEGVWPVEMAVWCLSVMAPGGVSLAPQPREGDAEGLLPNRTLVLWPYTDMADPRYSWGSELIRLKQEAGRGPTKYGLSVAAGWGAYANHGHLFLKEFPCTRGSVYPDGGCSLEAYTDESILELETLSPLGIVEPGATISHTEKWSLHDGFDLPAGDPEAVKAIERLRSL